MRKYLLLLLVLIALGCTPLTPLPAPEDIPYSYQHFMDDLQTADFTPELKEKIEVPYFTPKGQVMNLLKGKIQVFEYASNLQAKTEAGYVSPDGYIISRPQQGTTEVTWNAPPHFYRKGRIIVIYIGDNKEELSVLETIMGTEFAGAKTAKYTLGDTQTPSAI